MKARSKELIDRAISAMLGAIELYNKPNFPYRMETFAILAINGWELLLKAKWLDENQNKLKSLYVYERRKNKNGKQSGKEYIKKTRAGTPFTHAIDWLAKKLYEQKKLDIAVFQNLQGLIEIRDASIHFYTVSQDFNIRLYEYGAACVKNFIAVLSEWFKRELSELGLHLLPLVFLNLPAQVEGLQFNVEETALLRFLDNLDKTQSNPDATYSVTVNVEIKFTKSKAKDALGVHITNDPNAPEVRLTEEQIKEKYPWDYKTLTDKCRDRYSNFKTDNKYHKVRKSLMNNEKLGMIRYLDPNNEKSQKKPFFNPNILQEFDKYYNKNG
ncbi:MAG: DUF3644 domain-containing protein [Planctomycetaceae bacterium]|jgi:hypothetical protein|nr:DUF3644 domain-containing protein [Planctomycetaceae bacterium]